MQALHVLSHAIHDDAYVGRTRPEHVLRDDERNSTLDGDGIALRGGSHTAQLYIYTLLRPSSRTLSEGTACTQYLSRAPHAKGPWPYRCSMHASWRPSRAGRSLPDNRTD